MENILYLDDYINLYNKKSHKLIIVKPYKNTLRNGFVIDREKFIKKFNKILDTHNLKRNFFNESLNVIINNLYSKEDKLFIKELLENLNYKNIAFVQELEYLEIDKNTLYINCNYTYFYFIYTDIIGNIEINLYKNNQINKELFCNILKLLNKNVVILYGKNYKEIENILKREKIDYYFYEEADNLIINFLLNDKFM